MVSKRYDWANGVDLQPHTAKKLQVLREYFQRYLKVRCRTPQQTRFRIAIIDGFAGGGRYSGGEPGSPVVFVEVLKDISKEINTIRANEGMAVLSFECLLVVNDSVPENISILRENLSSVHAAAKEEASELSLDIEYMNNRFEQAYPKIQELLQSRGYKNILFNLDQCGHSMVDAKMLHHITTTFGASTEIFLTFAIQSLLTYLKANDRPRLAKQLQHLDVRADDLSKLEDLYTKREWLGAAEEIVFDAFMGCSQFVSPFSINNPDGWRYWLIHFARAHRARQVYNDVLHDKSSHQAHYGRSGISLSMFAYDPSYEGQTYLFTEQDRSRSTNQLIEDIPRVIEQFGDAISVGEFYEHAYNLTPAHSEDFKSAMFQSEDLTVLTPSGNERRKAHTISEQDTLQFAPQRTFLF